MATPWTVTVDVSHAKRAGYTLPRSASAIHVHLGDGGDGRMLEVAEARSLAEQLQTAAGILADLTPAPEHEHDEEPF